MNENRIEEFENDFADTAAAEAVASADGDAGEKYPFDEGAVGAINGDGDGLTVGDISAEAAGGAKTLREEYDELVKSRFKELYAEDMQRMINRRFRKYKIMEERYRILEESLKEKDEKIAAGERMIAEFDEKLRFEIEKTAAETEKSVLDKLRAKKSRPFELGIAPHKVSAPFDVSGLSRKERADIARRAAGGEKIKF